MIPYWPVFAFQKILKEESMTAVLLTGQKSWADSVTQLSGHMYCLCTFWMLMNSIIQNFLWVTCLDLCFVHIYRVRSESLISCHCLQVYSAFVASLFQNQVLLISWNQAEQEWNIVAVTFWRNHACTGVYNESILVWYNCIASLISMNTFVWHGPPKLLDSGLSQIQKGGSLLFLQKMAEHKGSSVLVLSVYQSSYHFLTFFMCLCIWLVQTSRQIPSQIVVLWHLRFGSEFLLAEPLASPVVQGLGTR